MSERPNVILALLLAVAATIAVSLVAAVSSLGACGASGFRAAVVGLFSACFVFFDELHGAPVRSLVLAAVVLASTYAAVHLLWQFSKARLLLSRVPLYRVETGCLADAGRRAGLARLYLTPATSPTAYCQGLLRPRVVVTAGLVRQLTSDELEAVIWHESHHASTRQPLKCLVARLVARAFFWIPSLADLVDRYLLAKELAADRLALERTSRAALAGALSTTSGRQTVAGAVGLSDLAAARIDRLFDPTVRLPRLFSHRRLVASTVSTVLVAAMVVDHDHVHLVRSAHLAEAVSLSSRHGVAGLVGGVLVNLIVVAALSVVSRRLRRHG